MSEIEPTFSVSEFVAVTNQTLEYAYPFVGITGELANFRVSKGKWVYFDLKDEAASVRFFGTVYQLSGPLEDGMLLTVRGTPRLHPQYGFSVTVQQIELVGEGTIKRAAALLETKLAKEGLFDAERKRTLPYPPARIGLITSGESAAYSDFMKIIKARWSGLEIVHVDVQVQGADAPRQLVQAVTLLNQQAEEPDVLVMIRGGGNPEDLQAFSDESVVRAIAGSRIPTLVGVGHENDISLAELAADQRASTPSNAAELLTPDKKQLIASLKDYRESFRQTVIGLVQRQREQLDDQLHQMHQAAADRVLRARQHVTHSRELLRAYDPQAALERGYAIIRAADGTVLRGGNKLSEGDIVTIGMHDADVETAVRRVQGKKKGQQ